MATKGIPAVPDVPTVITEADLQRILPPLKHLIDIRQGKFDPLDRWVTQQDLIDAGITTAAAVMSPVPVVPPTIQYNFNLTGDIIGGPTLMGGGNPTVNMPTAINLPNVVCIDGGSSTSTYPGQLTGPYGVAGGGGGSALEVQDEGVSLTVGGTLLNFVGDAVALTEPVANEITITVSSLFVGTDSEYCPGYTYVNISNTQWKVEGLDVTNILGVGRRMKFTTGGSVVYGTATVSAFSTDTTITMSMEAAAVLPTGTTEVCLTAGTAGWSPIATDPFLGSAINDICTGAIGATQWWFAVADGGKVGVSSNKGETWSILTTTTTADLSSCVYDSDNETFWAGGVGGIVLNTTNCTSVTEDPTSIPGLGGTTTDDIIGIAYNETDQALVLLYHHGTGHNIAWSLNQGVSWTDGANIVGVTVAGKALKADWASSTARANNSWTIPATNTQASFITAYNSSGFTTTDTSVINKTCMGFFWDGAAAARLYGISDGSIIGIAGWTGDDTSTGKTFSNQHNGIAYSATHGRAVCVGNVAQIGYLDIANKANTDAWTSISNGCAPTANINSVARNESDGVFVAVVSNGQILRSTNGIN